ncbi:MAG: hypothetical protein K2H76_01570 [Muribaculaceae bacterium]|nr:hypothetical protein [Muribaculaceae bacterium]
MKHPKLRDGKKLLTSELYPINEIPDEIIVKIAGYFVYLLYMGRKDITGEDWGDAFAKAINGTHLDSPIGIADVVKGKMAWSMKTVKAKDPARVKKIRLISGRCSPDYSYGITDPHLDIEKTGRAVLGIWNERINLALDHYNPVRTMVLVRSEDSLSFSLFEEDTHRFASNEYIWETNKNGNLIGKSIKTNEIVFTWQPHGSQFTIHCEIPQNAIRFKIRRPHVVKESHILDSIGFDESWVTIQRNI